MSGITKGDTGSTVILSSAILFYSGKRGEQYATVHPVTSTAGKASRPVIGAGRGEHSAGGRFPASNRARHFGGVAYMVVRAGEASRVLQLQGAG